MVNAGVQHVIPDLFHLGSLVLLVQYLHVRQQLIFRVDADVLLVYKVLQSVILINAIHALLIYQTVLNVVHKLFALNAIMLYNFILIQELRDVDHAIFKDVQLAIVLQHVSHVILVQITLLM